MLTLEHGQKWKPFLYESLVTHKFDSYGFVWEYIVKVWYQWPVAVVFHYMITTVHDSMGIPQFIWGKKQFV